MALSGLAHQLWLVVLLLAVAGAADLVSAVYRQTILQTYAPDEMRGRMQGVFIAVVAGGPRLGDLRAGATASVTTVDVLVGRRRDRVCRGRRDRRRSLVRPFWNYRDRPTSLRRMALSGQQFTISAGELEATVVEVGAGLRRSPAAASTSPSPTARTMLPPRCAGIALVPWPNRIRARQVHLRRPAAAARR